MRFRLRCIWNENHFGFNLANNLLFFKAFKMHVIMLFAKFFSSSFLLQFVFAHATLVWTALTISIQQPRQPQFQNFYTFFFIFKTATDDNAISIFGVMSLADTSTLVRERVRVVIIRDINVFVQCSCRVQFKQMINNALHLVNALFKDEWEIQKGKKRPHSFSFMHFTLHSLFLFFFFFCVIWCALDRPKCSVLFEKLLFLQLSHVYVG